MWYVLSLCKPVFKKSEIHPAEIQNKQFLSVREHFSSADARLFLSIKAMSASCNIDACLSYAALLKPHRLIYVPILPTNSTEGLYVPDLVSRTHAHAHTCTDSKALGRQVGPEGKTDIECIITKWDAFHLNAHNFNPTTCKFNDPKYFEGSTMQEGFIGKSSSSNHFYF